MSITPSRWKLSQSELNLSGGPLIMGILNVTPDSFSDGGEFRAVDRAIDHALAMQGQGADIIDVGGESTRPYADPVSESDELARIVPVLEGLQGRLSIPVSIDTSKAVVAQRAIELGAQIINDVTGLEGDPRMPKLAAESGVGVCAMHMQGDPRTMQDDPQYRDVVSEIHAYLRQRRDQLLEYGIDREAICLDPGIGFGKTHEHNFTLVRAAHRFMDLGCPILVGHSRKGFIAKQLGSKERDRTAATLAVSLRLAQQGVHVLRVHDVAETHDGFNLFAACGGWDEISASNTGFHKP